MQVKVVELALLDAIFKVLASHPYSEVADLCNALRAIETVETAEDKDDEV